MSSNEKLIVLDDVCKHFKVSGGMLKAVDHISLCLLYTSDAADD